MKKIQFVLSCCAAAFSASAAVVRDYQRIDGNDSAPLPGTVIYSGMFSDDSLWRAPGASSNYRNLLTIKREGGMLSVVGTKNKKTKDTAWNVATKPLPLTVKGLGYVFSFGIEANPRIKNSGGSPLYSSAVVWHDHEGKTIARDPFTLRTFGQGRRRAVMVGSVPAAAESFAIQFGFDRPNLANEDFIKLDALEFSVMPHETDPAWMHRPEPEAPRIKVVSETPFADPQAELKIAVTSRRPIDWSTLKIALDGKDATAGFARDGAVLSYRPAGKWEPGLHKAKVSLLDPDDGTTITAEKVFFCGQAAKGTPQVTLRDDGIALVDGKPFFPIGLYGLRALPLNGESIEKAVDDVAKGGFNLVHSYAAGTTKKFLDLAHSHGLMTWTGSRIPGTNFVETLCRHPAVLAWYVGDDTAMHFTPQQIYDRVDGVKAIDPTRITCQADAMNSGDSVSSYRPFVKVTDVFMPEIYPVHNVEPVPSDRCVAVTIRDMERFKRDVAEAEDDRPHAVWPIIQYFKGWTSWKRFPTKDELFAMTFAAIAHGAHGVTWYTYGGVVDPAKKRDNHGASSTPETWCNMTNLVARLRALSPVLVTRTPPQPAPAKILSGPEKDVLGNGSISMLMKRYRGETYLIAVNGTLADVQAEFDLGVRPEKADVLWENRTVPVSGGKIADCFAPLAVHVYKVEDPIAYIAHQGEEALAPSHSKPAYRLAAEHRLDYLKLDLRETKDGHVVLQHDGTLKAMMKWDVKISDYTLAEIRERGRYFPRGGYTNETIVTLQEALEIAKGMKKGVWFDFKRYTPAFAEKVFRIADEVGIPSDRIIVATFTKPALRWVQKNRPEVRRVAHTFIRKVKGGFQMNAGDEESERNKVHPSVDAVAEGLERHARDYGLYGFNVPHIYRNGRQLYNTPASLVKRLHDAGYWISIWFAYDAGTAEYYREAGADAFVTNWKDRTFPEYFPEKEKWASLMRLLARTELDVKDAGSPRRNDVLYFCSWEPELAADAIVRSGKWPKDCTEVIDILENAAVSSVPAWK